MRTYKSVFTRSLGVFSNRFVCLKSSVQQPPDQRISNSNTYNDILYVHKPFQMSNNDVIFDKMLYGKSVEEIMGYLNDLEPNTLTPNHIIYAVNRLVEVQYKMLYEQKQWMQYNHHIAYIQLLIQNSLQSSTQSFHQHPFFPKLHHILLSNNQNLNPRHLGGLYLHLCYLGFPLHDPLMAKLLINLQKQFDCLPLEQVHLFSQILKSLPGLNNNLYRKVLSSMRTITKCTDMSQEQLAQVSNVLGNVHKLVSPALALHFVKWFLRVLKSQDLLVDMDHISSYMRFVQNYYLAFSNCRYLLLEVVSHLLSALESNVDKMQSQHIAEVCRIFKAMRYPCDSFIRKVERRVADIVEEDLRLNEVVNLMHCVSTSSPRSLITILENILYSKLMQPNVEVDVVLLSNIADCLLDQGHINEDLLALVHQLTAENAHSIVAFVSRFSRFSRFLIRHPFKNPHHQHLFTSSVIHHLEGIYSVSLLSSSALYLHLLFLRSHHCLPHHLYMRFISSLPRVSSTELCRILRTLYTHEITASHQQKKRYISFYSSIYCFLNRFLLHFLIDKLFQQIHPSDGVDSTGVTV